MPPKIVLIRHAQGYHNVDNKSPPPSHPPKETTNASHKTTACPTPNSPR